jgi:hypothetical protein
MDNRYKETETVINKLTPMYILFASASAISDLRIGIQNKYDNHTDE